MRNYKIVQEEVLEKLAEVFAEFGYDGASLNQLAASSGLKKASLYHRFPKGKEQMGRATLSYLEDWIEKHIFSFLFKKGNPQERMNEVLGSILIFYDHGKKNCLMRTMNIGEGRVLFGEAIQDGFKRWMDGFTRLGVDFGLSITKAKKLAIEVMIKIQGALVVAASLDQPDIFAATLSWIKERYETKENKHSVLNVT